MVTSERAEVPVSEDSEEEISADEVERLEERVHDLLRAIDASRLRIDRLHASLDEALERNGLGRTRR